MAYRIGAPFPHMVIDPSESPHEMGAHWRGVEIFPRFTPKHHPVCGVVKGANWFAVCAPSVMSVPPWPSAAATKLIAM
jgi:hypothetical protein